MPGLVHQRVQHALKVHGAALVNGRLLERDQAVLTEHMERVYHTPCAALGTGWSVGLGLDGGERLEGMEGAASSLGSQEASLRGMVQEATCMFRADTPLYGHLSDHRDDLAAVNQRLLVLIDAIAVTIEGLETFCQRLEGVSELVAAVLCNKYHGLAEKRVAMMMTRLIMSCCHRNNSRQEEGKGGGGGEGGEFHPRDEMEMQLCYHLAEAISNPTPVARGLSLTVARDHMGELGGSSERVVEMIVREKRSIDGVGGCGDRNRYMIVTVNYSLIHWLFMHVSHISVAVLCLFPRS